MYSVNQIHRDRVDGMDPGTRCGWHTNRAEPAPPGYALRRPRAVRTGSHLRDGRLFARVDWFEIADPTRGVGRRLTSRGRYHQESLLQPCRRSTGQPPGSTIHPERLRGTVALQT